jgi:hypothetical protein
MLEPTSFSNADVHGEFIKNPPYVEMSYTDADVKRMVAVVKRAWVEINELGEGIPMSAETWDEWEEALRPFEVSK